MTTLALVLVASFSVASMPFHSNNCGLIGTDSDCSNLHRNSTPAQPLPYILCGLFLTPLTSRLTIRRDCCFGHWACANSPAVATGGSTMQYLPGWTVQCINQECSARGHWLRAHLSGPNAGLEFCPSCGSTLQAVPPPIGPRLRMRPRALAARPPLRPRPH